MSLTIELSPDEELQLQHAARQRGLKPADLARHLVTTQLPAGRVERAPIDEENTFAIALLEQWRREDATEIPNEIQKADRELNELLHNLNANRIAAGERCLFS